MMDVRKTGGAPVAMAAGGAADVEVDSRVREQRRAQSIADEYNIELIDLALHEIDHDLFRSIPVDLMFRYNFVPLHRESDRLVIAIADPTDILMMDELELLLNQPIEPRVAPLSTIHDILKKSESSQRVLDEATEDFRISIIQEEDEGEGTISIQKLTSDSSPIIKLIDSTIFNAMERRASDIHIEAEETAVVVKYRIDGVLYQAMEPIDKKFHSTMISRIKVMSELDIAEKRVPQDGRFKLRWRKKTIDFRVSIIPSIFGEDVVIRILDKEQASEKFKKLSLDILGFHERELKRFRKFIRQPYGMLLVTGPTGSGKTTTLYAAITEIKTAEEKFITVEDPVEYLLPGVVQIPINEKKGLTFARGLRSILRHDPDKIMVGEIRDPETAQIAVQSALTGHLVFTTVHANNVFDVIGRFLHMGVEPYNFISALNCVLAQRLVREICRKCKRPVEYSAEELEVAGLSGPEHRDIEFFEGAGCIDCNGTGYRGRAAIAEILAVTDEVREMILAKRPIPEIKRRVKETGIVFLREAAVEKLRGGETTLPEINKVTFAE